MLLAWTLVASPQYSAHSMPWHQCRGGVSKARVEFVIVAHMHGWRPKELLCGQFNARGA